MAWRRARLQRKQHEGTGLMFGVPGPDRTAVASSRTSTACIHSPRSRSASSASARLVLTKSLSGPRMLSPNRRGRRAAPPRRCQADAVPLQLLQRVTPRGQLSEGLFGRPPGRPVSLRAPVSPRHDDAPDRRRRLRGGPPKWKPGRSTRGRAAARTVSSPWRPSGGPPPGQSARAGMRARLPGRCARPRGI